MSKPILMFQLRPEDETADSEYEKFLKYGGLSEEDTVRIRLEKKGMPVIDLSHYSAIIVGGSPFDVTTRERDKSDVQKSIEASFNKLFDEIIDQDFPFLGACSGNGLLGSYLGGRLSRKYAEPICGTDIALTEEGKRDPLLKDLPEIFRALVGHKEACEEAPPGTTLLAYSKSCPVQMFRIKNNIYSTQFHPEADAEEFMLRIIIYKHHGYFPPEDADKLMEAVKNEEAPVPQEFLRRFVKRYLV